MFTSLSPGNIGIKATLAEGLALAREAGFEGLDFSIREVTDLVEKNGIDFVRHLFAEHGLRGGGWGMPVNFRKDEATLREELAALPRLAETAQALGWTRTATWILPFSDELDFGDNMAHHADRLRPIAEILEAHGILFGLEYVGPATLRAGHKYEFIHDLAGWRQLRDAIGTSNIGLLLDAYHWYVSGGTDADLESLENADIAVVHMNDAIAGVPRDEQLDLVRCLPGESGVVDLTTFLRALEAMGYDGPLTVEPFSQRLKEMTPQAAARETAQALNRVLADAGLR